MGKADRLKLGTWNTLCPICGFKFKANQMRKRWDGYMVDSKCWEPRHPQEYLRSIPDHQSVPWTYPDGKVPLTEIPPGGSQEGFDNFNPFMGEDNKE